MGALKFQDQLQSFGFAMDLHEARRVIKIYRETNYKINKLWRDAQQFLSTGICFGLPGVLKAQGNMLLLPSGLYLKYDDLQYIQGEKGLEFTYKVRRGRNRIYGGKIIENVCQAIARCIIGEQMLKIAKRYRVVLTVHDSIVCCVEDNESEKARKFIEESMRWTPDWAKGLPIDCESGIGKSYGGCE